jgi:hypothetical protein
MKALTDYSEIIGGKRYSTATATLIAGDDYWDGSNWERSGTNTFLYRTPNGNYFTVFLTQWQGQRDNLEPIDAGRAQELYEFELPEHYVPFEEAFPHVEVVDA